jgi:TP901 family phage tail tape measure protein
MLPAAIQPFGIAAGEFLAGIDQMIADTEKLAGSLDGSISAAAAASAAINEQAAAYARAMEAAGLYTDAQGRVRDANGRFASSAAIAAAGLDEEAAAAGRAAASARSAGDAAVAAGGKSKAAGAEAAGFGSAMKTALLGVAVAAVYGTDRAARFQSSMEQLHTQAGVAQDKIKGLSQQVLQLAGQVGEGPQSLSESLYHVASNMASLGASGPTMLNAVRVAAEGAQVGGASLVDVTNALTAAVASGIPGVQDFQQAMGALNATVGSGDMHMQDLADAFSTGLLASVKGYGLSLKDVGAALAVFGDNNIRGAKAGTDLRMAVQALAVPVAAGGKLLSSWGMTTGQLARDMSHGGLMTALDDLESHFRKNGVTARNEGEIITTLFGKKAGSGIAVLLEQMDRLKSKYPDITKSASDFAGAWQSRQQTMAQQWDNLKSGAQALAISFGTVLLPAATRVVGALAKFAALLEQHPALAAFAGAVLAVAAAFRVVAAAEAVFNAVTDANPVMLVIIAVIALTAALYELYKHSQLVRAIVADVGRSFASSWQAAMHGADAVIRWFVNGPLAFIKSQIAVFRQWWAQNGKEVEQVWRGVWGAIRDIAAASWKAVSAVVQAGLTVLLGVWKAAWGLVRDSAVMAWNVIKAVIQAGTRVVLDIISVFLDVITGHWSKAWHDIGRLFSDALQAIASIAGAFASGALTLLEDAGRNIVQGLINGIKSMAGAVMSAIGSIGAGIKGAFASVLHIASPSRVTYELGVMTGQGLAEGLAYSSRGAYDQAKKTAQNVGVLLSSDLAAGLEGTAAQARAAIARMTAAVTQEMNAGFVSEGQASSLVNYLQRDNSRLQSLAAQRSSIAKTIAAARSYAASTAGSTEQALGLMSAAGSTPLTAGDIATALRQDVSQITAFKNNIAKLAKMGLNKAYISELIQAGPVQGGQAAAELASGSWADIRAVNSAEHQIAAASTHLGYTAAEAMYDSGRQAGKGFLSGLEAQEKAVEKMMARIAQAAVQAMKRELKIRSPSEVFVGHGRQVVSGFVLGIEDGGEARVASAVKGLATAAAMPYGGFSGTGAGSGAGTTLNINVHVDGFVGSNQQLAGEIFTVFQAESLRNNRRNPTNGLSLPPGRG